MATFVAPVNCPEDASAQFVSKWHLNTVFQPLSCRRVPFLRAKGQTAALHAPGCFCMWANPRSPDKCIKPHKKLGNVPFCPDHMATVFVHWVEFFPSMTLQNTSMVYKLPPVSGYTTCIVTKRRNIIFVSTIPWCCC